MLVAAGQTRGSRRRTHRKTAPAKARKMAPNGPIGSRMETFGALPALSDTLNCSGPNHLGTIAY